MRTIRFWRSWVPRLPSLCDALAKKRRIHDLEMAGVTDPWILQPHRLGNLFFGTWLLDPSGVQNTDERPIIEFSAPISHENQDLLRGDILRLHIKTLRGQLSPAGIIPRSIPTAYFPDSRQRLETQAYRLGMPGQPAASHSTSGGR